MVSHVTECFALQLHLTWLISLGGEDGKLLVRNTTSLHELQSLQLLDEKLEEI